VGEAEEAECLACHREEVQHEVLEELQAVEEVQEAQEVQELLPLRVEEGLKADAS
jgi:Zn-finger protein